MSKKLKAAVVVLALLLAATGFSWPAMAGGREQYLSPLYIAQLQQFAEQAAFKEMDLLDYTVQKGDNLTAIAGRFGTEAEALAGLNDIANPHLIYAGQTIKILIGEGAVHRVESGETLDSIARLYGVDPGSIIPVNHGGSGTLLQRGERVIIPGAGNIADIVSLGWPVSGGRISSGFGRRGDGFHYGIDLAVPLGHPVYAAGGGIVSFSGYQGSYGLMVEVDHGGGWQTRYAHAGKIFVSTGQKVAAGQLLGEVGLTGNTTGSHLHFEVVHYGLRIDPLRILP